MHDETIKCFVGHVFNREQIDDLRTAIKQAFRDWQQFSLWFADDHYISGHILNKITDGIDECLFCIFELSNRSKPNVFLELGYAIGKGKTCLLLVKQGHELPSDLAGLDRVEYQSMAQVTVGLQRYLPQVIKDAVSKGRVVARLDIRMLKTFPPVSAGDILDIAAIVAKVRSAGVPEQRIAETIKALEDPSYVQCQGDKWLVTEMGAACISKLVELARGGG